MMGGYTGLACGKILYWQGKVDVPYQAEQIWHFTGMQSFVRAGCVLSLSPENVFYLTRKILAEGARKSFPLAGSDPSDTQQKQK
jgi:hypothetical protein